MLGSALVMVDLKTAMAAAQAERMKRDGAKNAEKKKRRSGADLGIEPFDPVKYHGKERADTASMWLVIAYAFHRHDDDALRADALHHP